jgi:hypothetical protein
MTDLCALAQRYVSLTTELEDVRQQMKTALLNGGGSETARPPTSPRQGRNERRELLETSAARDEAVMALLKDGPMSQAALVRAIGVAQSTTQQRLQRLLAKGLLARSDDGDWSIAPSL